MRVSYIFKEKSGDTLIEVIIAFAILGVLIGSAFSGVMQARRTAISAQQRTQASLVAIEQANLLVNFRSGQPWNSGGGSNPNYIDSISSTPSVYCMNITTTGPTESTMVKITSTTSCDSLASYLKAYPGKNIISIEFSNGPLCPAPIPIANCDEIKATVSVTWSNLNSNKESVKNIVILAKNTK